MGNEFNDKIAACRVEIQSVTEKINEAQQLIQNWTNASKDLSLSAAKTRAANGVYGQGFLHALLGVDKFARQAAARANRNLAVEVAEKRSKIAEGKRAAQELQRQLKARLSEATQLLKSLEAQAKSVPGKGRDAREPAHQLRSPTAPSSGEVRDAARIANELIDELVPVLHTARPLFPSEFAEKLTPAFARNIIVADVWASVVAIVKADGTVSPDEMVLFRTAFETFVPSLAGASAEQVLSFVPGGATPGSVGAGNSYSSHIITLLQKIDSVDGTSHASRYASAVFRILNLMARADGSITPKEEEALHRFRLAVPTFQPVKAHAKQEEAHDGELRRKARSLEDLLEELEHLVGLNGVKTAIKELCNFVRIQQTRAAHGLRSTETSLHVVFSGNPGTGKTTVARLLSEIYAALGVVSKGHLVEADRAGLVAGYTGQTALKVAAVVESARGGVLFIDEAYALTRADESSDSFGDEAVETLLKRMEDLRADLVVVAAGYTEEMRLFIDSNPGLRSRFTRSIAFDDYSPKELVLIVERLAAQQDYQLLPAANARLLELFETAYQARDKNFGNARFARNVFEKAISNQATRVVSIPKVTAEILRSLQPEDVPEMTTVSGA